MFSLTVLLRINGVWPATDKFPRVVTLVSPEDRVSPSKPWMSVLLPDSREKMMCGMSKELK